MLFSIGHPQFKPENVITFLNVFKQKTVILNCNNISQYYCFYCIIDQINAAVVSRKDCPNSIAVFVCLFNYEK